MKKLLFSLTALVLTTGIFAQGKKADEVAKFTSESIDLGKIKQGSPTTAKFIVNNISGEELIIEQANPTCGCTISDYTKTPISAGNSGEINATYNAANAGSFEKRLTVKFKGIDEIKYITIKGQVLTADEYAKLNGEPVPAAVPAPATEKAPVADVKVGSISDEKPAAPAKSTAPAKAKKPVKKTPAKSSK
jgi:hypothetical protein